jgi:hypothetical protein
MRLLRPTRLVTALLVLALAGVASGGTYAAVTGGLPLQIGTIAPLFGGKSSPQKPAIRPLVKPPPPPPPPPPIRNILPPTIDSTPTDGSFHTTATFTFSHSNPSGLTFWCRVDAGSYAQCTSPKTYAPLHAGSHQFDVVSFDGKGFSRPNSFQWGIVAPPAPSIDSSPDDPTPDPNPSFGFSDTDTDTGVSFECKLDGGGFTGCSSPQGYTGVSDASHTFQVRLLNAAGDPSSATSFQWTVNSQLSFPISGDLTGLLRPGLTIPLSLTLTNPFNWQISVSNLTVTVRHQTSEPDCDGQANLSVQQYSGGTVTVTAHSSVTLPADATAPQITMVNLPTNQDACQGATFTFDYSASSTKLRNTKPKPKPRQ